MRLGQAMGDLNRGFNF
ncbi:hypothetical protein Golax_013329 [Gossypium laxum]|uniref:Uncharacterized protein n=1 Tax=Gossypium laxum TaxID=34288 RepID=A0A7J8ZRP6_9ROSI|nr:hypothetical protein [Gossypium laxum]